MIFLVKFPGLSSALISAKDLGNLKFRLGEVFEVCDITEWTEPMWVEFIPPELFLSELASDGDRTQIIFLEESLDKFFKMTRVTNGVLPSANPEARNESVMRREIMKKHYPNISELIDSRSRDRSKLREAIKKDIHFPTNVPGNPHVRFKLPATAASVGLSEEMLKKADKYYEERVADGEKDKMDRESQAFEQKIGQDEQELEEKFQESENRTEKGSPLFNDLIKRTPMSVK